MTDHTTPDDEFADLDPLVESVNDECPTCGAWMLNVALHENWHQQTEAKIREARRYPKSPATYGGLS